MAILANVVVAPTLKLCYEQLVEGEVGGIVYDASVLNFFVHAENIQSATTLLKIVDAPFTVCPPARSTRACARR